MVQNSLESNVPDEQSSELAIACAKKMGSADSFSHSLGIQLSHIDVGKSIMTLQVTANMVNGYNTCHGGVIFSFADTAFAYACNSQNQLAVAASCNIDFVRPAMIGDTLTATSTMQYQGHRTGVYQTIIINQDDKLIAIFKGNSARLGKTVLNFPSKDSL